MYQMALKCSKYTHTFRSKALQNLPKVVFLVWKYAIWQPCSKAIPTWNGFDWRAKRLRDRGSRVTRLGGFSPNGWLFGQFLDNYKNSQNLCATFPLSIDCVLILTKILLGYTLDVFLQTNLVTLRVSHILEPILWSRVTTPSAVKK
jgi:hypothetical protein